MTPDQVENILSGLLQEMRKGSTKALDNYCELTSVLYAYQANPTPEKWWEMKHLAEEAMMRLPTEENSNGPSNPRPDWSELEEAIRRAHGCESEHIESVAVVQRSEDKIEWQGRVEVFRLIEHPKAKRVYAWKYRTGSNQTRCITVLENLPVDSPQSAVKLARGAQPKRGLEVEAKQPPNH